MNQNHTPASRPTLFEALMLDDPAGDIAGLCYGDFDFSPQERSETSALWLYLTGVSENSVLSRVAETEVQSNPDIFVMLNSPACEFLTWFRRDEWSLYTLTEKMGIEEWGYTVLERARAMCVAMGALALQMPLRLPIQR